MTNLLLDIDVIGTPRPKGSLRHVGHGRLVEQLKHSPDWRHTIVETAGTITRADGDTWTLRDGYPSTDPADVRIELRFSRPKSAPKRVVWPSSRSTGDADKHARNCLDALVDAGVLKDDSQVINLLVVKRYCAANETPGARITVRRAA